MENLIPAVLDWEEFRSERAEPRALATRTVVGTPTYYQEWG
jgi:hypothetical protein